MFDTMKTGQRIVEFRKRKNLTQAELADMMNVSYQAISNWERGNSMPDISKLPDLAAAFDCNIEALLGTSEKTDLIFDILNANTEEMKEKMTVERLSDLAPILKPDQTAPFLKTDHLNEMMEICFENGTIHEVVSIYPFISKTKLQELATQIVETEGPKGIIRMAPFL